MKPPRNPGSRYADAHVGGDYVVLAIYTHHGDRPYYQIVGDADPRGRQQPVLIAADRFEVVSNKLASNWRVRVLDEAKGSLQFGPESWFRPGFWDEYWKGGRAAANDEYDREVAIILSEETAPTSTG